MSQRNSGYAKKPLGAYMTPEWCTQALMAFLPRLAEYPVWEPACGTGSMVSVLRKAGFSVVGTDIDAGVDFLRAGVAPTPAGKIGAIITNPPYDLATEFIEHALRLTERDQGVVAMLLRCDFDHAQSRTHLFRDNPAFYKKLVLLRRIVWFDPGAGNRTGKSPSYNHSWFLFDHMYSGPPTISYAK
jgi:hypothetical protein